MNIDPFAELEQSDPAGALSPTDMHAVTQRVMTRRLSVWRSWRVRAAGTVAVAGAVVAGAIATLGSSGPALAPLALSSQSRVSPSAHGASSAMVICTSCMLTPYHFIAGDIPTDASTEPVYMLQSEDASQIASDYTTYLGLNVSSTSGSTDVATATSGTTTIDTQGQPVGSVVITDATGVALPGAHGTDDAALEAATQALVAAGQVDYQLVDPTVSGQDSSVGLSVTYGVAVDGHTITNLNVEADFTTAGDLTFFSAPIFQVASSTSYPVASPASAVDLLNAEADSARSQMSTPSTSGGVVHGGVATRSLEPTTTMPTGPSGATGASGVSTTAVPSGTTGSNATTSPVTTTTPVVRSMAALQNVTITSATINWYLTNVADGRVAIIPVYDLHAATVTFSFGGNDWRVPALSPSVATFSDTWEPYYFYPYAGTRMVVGSVMRP